MNKTEHRNSPSCLSEHFSHEDSYVPRLRDKDCENNLLCFREYVQDKLPYCCCRSGWCWYLHCMFQQYVIGVTCYIGLCRIGHKYYTNLYM